MSSNDLCVARVPIFQGLDRSQQEHVAEFATPLHVERGTIVASPGQQQSRLLVLHTGKLKISHGTAGGQEQVLRTATVGDVVGERAFITGQLSTDSVTALEDSQMCVFEHRDLARLLGEYPDISQRMLRTLSDRLASTERLLAAITSSDVSARVAAYLLDQPAKFANGIARITLPMAKKDIAAYLGTTPETLSRRLAAFAQDGSIELAGRREINILDVEALEETLLEK